MNDTLRETVLVLIVAAAALAAGWAVRGAVWRRGRRRTQRFFGLPDNSECLFVVGRETGAAEWPVTRGDALALLELSAHVKECGAHAELVPHDAAQQGFGERTEFCVGGPGANRRMAAHLTSLLPGVRINAGPDAEPGPDRGAFAIGGERYRMANGSVEHVLLARLTAGQNGNTRPVFLFCGQRPVTHQAASRYLARNHARLARKYGSGSFCLLLKVVNSQAYGPDVVELVSDVTRAATSPPPAAAPAPNGGARKGGSHRAP
ncbi:hypothetical protein [Streptomyces sp. HNM0574]|uniref:hypothetical protein n=1 Tax=Streptomyces sp. HNM0574 TaxID=2714954 RepID=UPI001469BE4E|nr:hypothetical protein [Streptomyces sp. HNM0574]NLU65990.1 hypothetical protein [Streptomyces sp. HNM0574]